MSAPQRSEAWFSARKNRVTGSMVGAILGLSPFMTRADAMRSMVRSALGEESEFTGNVATQWGTVNEAGARGEYEMESLHDVQDAGFVTHEDWLGASPDGYVRHDGLVEFKCPYSMRDNKDPVFKSINSEDLAHYYAQVQTQLFVTGRRWAHFYQWAPHGSKLEKVDVNQDWINENLPKLRQFYAEFLHELEHNPNDYRGQKRPIIDTPDAHKMLKEYDDINEVLERFTQRKKDLIADIAKLAGDKSAVIAGRKVTKIDKAGSISYGKAIKELLPDADLEKWRGAPSTYWIVS